MFADLRSARDGGASTLRRLTTTPGSVLAVLLAVVPALFLVAYLPQAPAHPYPASGWYTWWDQTWYLRSTVAFLRGDLSPTEHWYPAAYSLLGAASARLAPIDPFLLPNLLSLLICAVLSLSLGRTIGVPPAVAALAFLVATVATPRLADVWAQPWSTTPAAAAILVQILLALAFARSPRDSTAGLFGLTCGVVAWLRPTDAVAVSGALAPLLAIALVRRRVRPALWIRFFLAASVGFAAVMVPAVWLHVAIHGWRPSPYMGYAGLFGFGPAAIPHRWITIGLDARPFLPAGRGLAAEFWWFLPGLAAGLFALWTDRGRRLDHAMVLSPALSLTVLYLCFRDLNQPNLWIYWNYHYFKIPLLIFALYVGFLVVSLPHSRSPAKWMPLGIVAALVLALSNWRVELVPVGPTETMPASAIRLARGLGDGRTVFHVASDTRPLADRLDWLRMDEAEAIAAGRIPPDRLAASRLHLRTGDAEIPQTGAVRRVPFGRDLLVFPLRTLPSGPVEGRIDGLGDEPVRVTPFEQRFRFAPPCWVPGTACRPPEPVPPQLMEIGRSYPLSDPDMRGLLVRGFSVTEPWGVWTDGPSALLIGRIPAGEAGLRLVLTAAAYRLPWVGDPLTVGVAVNGRPVASLLAGPQPAEMRIPLPADAVGVDGGVVVDLRIDDPTVPVRFGVSPDRRALGLGLRAVRIERDTP